MIKPCKYKNSEVVIRESDRYRVNLIVYSSILLLLIIMMPWFLQLKPVFFVFSFITLFVFFIVDLKGYIKSLKEKAIVLTINKDGVSLSDQCFYRWDEIQYIKVQLVIDNKDRFKLFFFVKPKCGTEVRAPIGDYFLFRSSFCRNVECVAIESTGCMDIFRNEIPSLWEQLFYKDRIKQTLRD